MQFLFKVLLLPASPLQSVIFSYLMSVCLLGCLPGGQKIIVIITCTVSVVELTLGTDGTDGDMQWYLSQVKGTIEEDVTEGK